MQGNPRNSQDGEDRKKSAHVVLDVRDQTQFGLCSLSGSLNIPWTLLQGIKEPHESSILNENDLPALNATKSMQHSLFSLRDDLDDDASVYTICRYGNDSQLAVQKLKELGFDRGGQRRIVDIKDGFKAWKREVDLAWPDY